MADETLTEVERVLLADGDPDSCDKALRIIDAQAQRIARALQIASEPLPAGSAEDRLAGDVRRALE